MVSAWPRAILVNAALLTTLVLLLDLLFVARLLLDGVLYEAGFAGPAGPSSSEEEVSSEGAAVKSELAGDEG